MCVYRTTRSEEEVGRCTHLIVGVVLVQVCTHGCILVLALTGVPHVPV